MCVFLVFDECRLLFMWSRLVAWTGFGNYHKVTPTHDMAHLTPSV